MKLTTRSQLADLLNGLELRGEAAFIGIAEAYFEHHFLERWRGTGHLIDPWAILHTPGFSGHGEDSDAGQESRYQRVLRLSQRFGNRCKVHRTTSEQAAPQFQDGSLDFVYLDAQHDYPSIKRDLDLWYPKLLSKSLFAGHDYLSGHFNGQEYGVKQAVGEFASAHGLTVNVIAEEWPSWWAAKP